MISLCPFSVCASLFNYDNFQNFFINMIGVVDLMFPYDEKLMLEIYLWLFPKWGIRSYFYDYVYL